MSRSRRRVGRRLLFFGCTKNDRFWYPPPPAEKLPGYAYNFVSKLIPKTEFQNLTNSMSFGGFVVIVTITTEQKKRLLKANFAVTLHNELGRTPKTEEIEYGGSRSPSCLR
jgi:hypothetical protein